MKIGSVSAKNIIDKITEFKPTTDGCYYLEILDGDDILDTIRFENKEDIIDYVENILDSESINIVFSDYDTSIQLYYKNKTN